MAPLPAPGNSTPVTEASGGSEENATAAARAHTKADAEETEDSENGAASGDDGDDDSQTDTEKGDISSESGSEGSASSGGDETGGPVTPGGGSGGSGKQSVSSKEKGRIPLAQTDKLSAPTGGGTERNNDYQREMYSDAAADTKSYWIRWRRKRPVSSLSPNAHENSTMWLKIYPTGIFTRVFTSE